ncbi:MAG: ABC transporter permease [Thermoguttaceae bacterium]|nr:ABC transporter permease [Thermoguttaceae bacterium]
MNKILAVFRKEYLETRTTTLIFLLVGVLFPLIKLLGFSHDVPNKLTYLLYEDPVALGGIFAVWLNAAIMCATTFAREQESGTFETLRRVAPDWRVAVVGKFGYVLVSTLALAAFFFVESIVAAKICGYRPFEWSLGITSGRVDDFFAISLLFAITTICWGVFWTGRVSRQTTSIFLTFLFSIVVIVVAGLIAVKMLGLSSVNCQFFIEPIVGVIGLFALVAAPFTGRFGYLENEKTSVLTSSETESIKTWNHVDVEKRSGAFSTLVSLAFTDAALLFKSPISILFETSILFAVCFILSSVDWSRAGERSLIALLFYYMLFASGLFMDSKRKDSIVRERLNVKPGEYWLANALAGFVVWTLAFVTLIFTVPSGRGHDAQLINSVLYGFFIWSFGLSLWCEAFKASRLVVGAVTVAVFFFTIIFGGAVFYFVAPEFLGGLENAIRAFPFVGLISSLVFAFASYRIVTRRVVNRKATWSVAIPTVLVVSVALFLLIIRAL